MTQETRNKIYGAVSGVFGVLVILGVVDKATSDEATTLLNTGLDLVPQIVGLATAVLAFVKSLPSRVTVIETPTKKVAEVVQTDGTVVAGPASPLPTGTVLGTNSPDTA